MGGQCTEGTPRLNLAGDGACRRSGFRLCQRGAGLEVAMKAGCETRGRLPLLPSSVGKATFPQRQDPGLAKRPVPAQHPLYSGMGSGKQPLQTSWANTMISFLRSYLGPSCVASATGCPSMTHNAQLSYHQDPDEGWPTELACGSLPGSWGD